MSREKPIISTVLYEDIISYEYSKYSKVVKILVGTGTRDTSGQFIPNPEQNYEYITLSHKDFEELMQPIGGKPAGVFRTEDLWTFIDKHREQHAKSKNII